MGTFKWPVRVSSIDGERSVEVEATVDTGAFYSQFPARLLRSLGIEPDGSRRLRLADGQFVDADVGPAFFTVNGARAPTLVVFGDDDAPVLLGAFALEGLRLLVDPEGRRLIPNDEVMLL